MKNKGPTIKMPPIQRKPNSHYSQNKLELSPAACEKGKALTSTHESHKCYCCTQKLESENRKAVHPFLKRRRHDTEKANNESSYYTEEISDLSKTHETVLEKTDAIISCETVLTISAPEYVLPPEALAAIKRPEPEPIPKKLLTSEQRIEHWKKLFQKILNK